MNSWEFINPLGKSPDRAAVLEPGKRLIDRGPWTKICKFFRRENPAALLGADSSEYRFCGRSLHDLDVRNNIIII
jgi:hypothetical protein